MVVTTPLIASVDQLTREKVSLSRFCPGYCGMEGVDVGRGVGVVTTTVLYAVTFQRPDPKSSAAQRDVLETM